MPAHFTSAQITVFYPQTDPKQMDLIQANSIVSGKYLPFNFVNDGDSNSLAMAFSENGNSQIFISRFSSTMAVKFTPDWQTDGEKGKDYVLNRIPLIVDIVSSSLKVNPLYVGVVVDTVLPITKDDATITSAIMNWIGGTTIEGETVSDMGFSKSLVESKNNYLNTNVSNYRDFSFNGPPSPQLRMNNAAATQRGISVNIDYNNRYAYNIGKSVDVNEDSIRPFVHGAFKHAENVIQAIEASLVHKGE